MELDLAEVQISGGQVGIYLWVQMSGGQVGMEQWVVLLSGGQVESCTDQDPFEVILSEGQEGVDTIVAM